MSITEGLALLAGARHAFAVTPHDTNLLAAITRAIYVGGAGNLTLILAEDNDPVTLTGVTAGTLLPVQARVIKATDTTATLIIALY